MSLLQRLGLQARAQPPLPDLSWVDEFIDNVRPYIFVRTEDNLLIKRPNQAQQLNDQGAWILKLLLDGNKVSQLLDQVGDKPAKIHDIANFLHAVRLFLENGLDANTAHPAVEIKPFDRHFSSLPILSEVAITYKCNLRCVFCYAGCNCTTQPVDDTREMTTPEIKQVLDRLYHQGKVPSVSFTGGEPTLRKELPELVAYAKELGMRVNLITNGTRVNAALARELADAGLSSAQVSLEGTTETTHNLVTRGATSFNKTIAAIEYFKQAHIRVHTNTTINRLNLREMPEMPRFVRHELGNQRFSMNLLVPTGSAMVHPDLIVRYRDIGPWLERIKEQSDEQEVEFMWYSPTPMCMFNPVTAGLGNHGCSACDGLISIAPNGDLIPCASYDDSLGNLLETDLPALWNSPRAEGYRDKALAHPQCRDCDQFDICNGACPLYWREMGFDELEQLHGFDPVEARRSVTQSQE